MTMTLMCTKPQTVKIMTGAMVAQLHHNRQDQQIIM